MSVSKRRARGSGSVLARALAGGCFLLLLGGQSPAFAQVGVERNSIRLGSVLDLQGDSRGLGLGMKAGMQAAFARATIGGRRIELVALNDNYSPPKTIEATNRLVEQGIFAMIGNVGTPTAQVSLPILARNGIPAIGFFTGAGLLRPGEGDIVNFRASYVQETAAAIESALAAGIAPTGICAYVQNDAYGMAGVIGIERALGGVAGAEAAVERLAALRNMPGSEPPRNNFGPVGVYQRNTLHARRGYDSLKRWERQAGVRCRLVVSVGTYQAIARFAAYSRMRGDDWMISAVSFTGADNFRNELEQFQVRDRIIMTQVVPPLDSDLPIVRDARAALGDDLGYVSLEGYIVGRLFMDALQGVSGAPTRQSFLEQIRGRRFDLGGLEIDFSTDNQASDFVSLTYLGVDGYRPLVPADWRLVLDQ